MADVSWTSQSPQATSPSVIARQPTRTSPGPWPPVASHVFGPATTQVDPDLPDRESRQTTNWHHKQDPNGPLHWFPSRELKGSAAPPELCDVSQGTIRPTVDISPNVIASSRAVGVDVPIERPSLPHFATSNTRQFSPIVAADKRVASSLLSRGVAGDTHSKRLYAAAHAPLTRLRRR